MPMSPRLVGRLTIALFIAFAPLPAGPAGAIRAVEVTAGRTGADAPSQADCPTDRRPGTMSSTPLSGLPILGGAAADDLGGAFVGTDDGQLHSVDCRGQLRWSLDIATVLNGATFGQGIREAPLIDTRGWVVVATTSERVNTPGHIVAVAPGGDAWVDALGPKQDDRFRTALVESGSGKLFIGGLSVLPGRNGLASSVLDLSPPGRLLAYTNPVPFAPIGLADGRVVFLGGTLQNAVDPSRPPGLPITPTPARPPPSSVPPPTPPLPSSVPPRRLTPTPAPTPSVPARVPTLPVASRLHLPLLWNDPPLTAATAGAWRADQATPTPPPLTSLPFPTFAATPTSTPDPLLRLASEPQIYIVEADGVMVRSFGMTETPASQAVALGGTIIFQATDADGGAPRLIALDLAVDPPRRLWSHATRGRISGAPVLGRVDAATGRVELIYHDQSGLLVSLDVPVTGADTAPPIFKWAWSAPRDGVGAPVLGAGSDDGVGHVYLATTNAVSAFRRSDGRREWSVDIPGDTLAGSPILAPGGLLFIGSQLSRLYTVSTESDGIDTDAAWPSLRHDARNTGRAQK